MVVHEIDLDLSCIMTHQQGAFLEDEGEPFCLSDIVKTVPYPL